MGIFGTKEKNYDNEIMELNNKTSELSKATDKNKSDIILFGNDVTELKEEMKYFLEQYKVMSREHSEMKKLLEDFKNDKEQEIKIKKGAPNILTCEDICSEITEVKYLNPTSLKYYLYELGLLKLNINKRLNTYKAVSNYKEICTDISQYMHVTGRVITFDKDVMSYFNEHLDDLRKSIEKYLRKMDQFTKSKNNIDVLKVKNYQTEIGNICGTSVNGSYDGTKWGQIYTRYSVEHEGWEKKYDKWAENYMAQHPKVKYKPTKITYLVQQCCDGDVLLKIACELFVD